ncbi:hypothetical protein DJ95_1411 [Bacillus atrophaeus subsp. globigii]|uniref:Uncharacterized protein n=2 Tax=Bacillus atrophaeus TaxID=1452 RepID=A0ABM5LXX2_BACA1|nr:hypothetical protein BATR1942_07560 [Bacillus atrophaeus 1942]AIK46596.1 hypothetical protein DJ95_1411 [Bacillus atrophaeus subsp. globigii]AMR62688.1 hypothetical protein A1D11_09845 [Bacillus subtilis subsp. globigii]EIM11749.1 hypothetical protein UY9_05802 [Bacillus atrophaeus C89]KFK82540.1 hypothetical protein DK44_2225 [Bacillus atrophaeus]
MIQMEKRKIQGLLSFEIIQKKDDLLGELKSALKELFKTYIETTPIEIEKLEFEELDNEIRVEYEFTNVIFSIININLVMTNSMKAHQQKIMQSLDEPSLNFIPSF